MPRSQHSMARPESSGNGPWCKGSRFDSQSRCLPLLEKVAVGAVGAVGAYQCDQCDQQFWRDTLSEKSPRTLVPLVPPVTAGTAGTAGSRVSAGDVPIVWLIADD
jgi:hypothetical protein